MFVAFLSDLQSLIVVQRANLLYDPQMQIKLISIYLLNSSGTLKFFFENRFRVHLHN